MLKKITVYGKLRRFLGQSTFEADVNSAREAYSFLLCNFKGIEEHMREQLYVIKIGTKVITSDLLNMQTEKEIKIIPVVHGNFITLNSKGDHRGYAGGGVLVNQTSLGGVRFSFSSNDVNNLTARMYGLVNS